MNKYIEKYRKIIDRLVEKSFPSLKGKKIIIKESGNSRRYHAVVFEFLFLSLILTSKKCRKLSDKALKALFAHELAHQEIIKQMKFFEMISYFLRWLFLRRVKVDFERRTDLLVIKKQYGNELIELKKQALKGKDKEELKKIKKRGYLSLEEIKSYIKKFKK